MTSDELWDVFDYGKTASVTFRDGETVTGIVLGYDLADDGYVDEDCITFSPLGEPPIEFALSDVASASEVLQR